MKAFVRKHINTECISLGFTLDWNVNLGIEIDFLFWIFDWTIIENFRRYRRWIGPKIHRHAMKMKGE